MFALLALGALAWAAGGLSGQANKSAADAGSSAADMEMASLDTIKAPQKAPNVDWQAEKRLRKDLERQDSDYRALVEQAKGEIVSEDAVSEGTRGKLMASANEFKATSDEYAVVWEKGNCTTRANLAREAGASRVAGAELIAYGADSDKADALKAQQDKLNKARNAYVQEASANNELSAADKADIKAAVMPRAEQLVGSTGDLVSQVTGLLDQVRSQASPDALVGGVSGCAAKGGSGGGADDAISSLLGPVSSLLSLAEGMFSNAQSLMSDATLLAQ